MRIELLDSAEKELLIGFKFYERQSKGKLNETNYLTSESRTLNPEPILYFISPNFLCILKPIIIL